MVIFSILSLLLCNSITLKRDMSILFSRVSIIILLYSCYLTIESLYITNLDKGIGLFGGLFHATSNTHIFHFFMFIVSSAILQLTGFYPRKVFIAKHSSLYKILFFNVLYNNTKITNKMSQQFTIIEYPLIILFIITGGVFLICTNDLVSIFLSIELQSYGLYLLCTLYRNSESATSGGLMYFLLGSLSSCFILLGTSLLYINSGTTNLDGLYVITNLSAILDNNQEILQAKSFYINISLIILSVGFLFKVSAAPFHFWSPDVYDAIPTVITTFVAIIAKISIFVFLLDLVNYTNSYFSFKGFNWTFVLLISSLLSLVIGTVGGLTQSRIKRLYAYSTISHLGFILLALTINSIESIQAFIFYLMQYSLSNLNAFLLLISIGFSLYLYSNQNEQYKEMLDKNNSPIQLINQLKGYFYINPLMSVSLAITIFSFVGIPPLIGFFAKQMVLSAALDSGYFFISLIAILTSVISAVYYLIIIKQLFFEKPEYEIINDNVLYATIKNKNISFIAKLNNKNVVLSNHLSITISILTLITLLFIFVPQEWLSMANILALVMFNP